ncbi:MAG: alpha/beta hydrolase [Bacteroidota bacterium]
MRFSKIKAKIPNWFNGKIKLLISFITLGFVLSSCNKEAIDKVVFFPRGEQPFIKNSDVLWASPKGFGLTMDIYVPNSGRENYPVIVMFHGGGWLINNKSIMNDASEYLASKGEYIVCNVNYRLLGDLNNSVKMNEIVEDAFGAVLWVKDNIAKYKGDPTKIAVTGDSSGGHMAMMVLTQGHNLEADGFAGNSLGFNPTYLPKGKTAEQVAIEKGLEVQAAMLGYGVFDVYGSALIDLESGKNSFWTIAATYPRGIFGVGINVKDHPNHYKQVSPIYTIPQSTERKLPPMFFSVGSDDFITKPESIETFIIKLHESGQRNTNYFIHTGRTHAFLDSGSNLTLKTDFKVDAPPVLDKMITFLNNKFY